jgi:hypothetical protein
LRRGLADLPSLDDRGRRKKLVAVLLYSLEIGAVEQKIIEDCARNKRPLPPKILNKPELVVGLELYLEAYMDLQGDRGGMGDGRIPWTAVQKYADVHGYEGELLEALHYHIRALDDAWLRHVQGERERDRKGKLRPSKA